MASSDSLDTSVIVHCIMNDVPEQRALTLELLNTPNTVHYIADMAIAEAIYVLTEHYFLDRNDAADRVAMFLTRYGDRLRYNHDLTAVVFPMYFEHPALSFFDCCLAAYAELNHAEPLFTFDRKLAKQSASAKRLE